jgi:hypothetical protein
MKTPRRIQLPPITGLQGPERRGSLTVTTGKPPKRRFQPGDCFELDGKRHQVVYVYRMKEKPHEWIYMLEEVRDPDGISALAEAFGCGKATPRIANILFRDHYDAHSFFCDIPANGDRAAKSNKQLLQLKQLDPICLGPKK